MSNSNESGPGGRASEMGQPETCWVYPDTNIFMHFRSVEELPLAAIVDAHGQITVVVTPSVVDELDLQKIKNPNPDLSQRAKEVLGRFRKWRRSGTIALANGARLAFRVQRHGKDLRELGLDSSIRDDHLLAEIVSERDARTGRHILLTADFGPEVRAESLKIEAVSPPEEFRLRVPNAMEKKLRQAESDLQQIRARRPILVLRFPSDGQYRRFPVRRPAPLTKTDIQEMIEKKRDAMVMALPRPALPNEAGFVSWLDLVPTAAGVQHYNEEVLKYLPKYEEYLQAWWLADQQLQARTLEIQLELCNDGNATASTVRIEVNGPSDIKLVEYRPKGRQPPSPPERPLSSIDLFQRRSSELLPHDFRPPVQPNVRGPFVSEAESPTVTFRVDKALHKQAYEFQSFFLIYPTVDAIRPIALQTSIVSDEFPDWIGGELHVVIDFENASEAKQTSDP